MGLADPCSFAVAKEGMTWTNQCSLFSLNSGLDQHAYHSNFIGVNDIIDATTEDNPRGFRGARRQAVAAVAVYTKLMVLESRKVFEANAWEFCDPSAFIL